MKRGPLPMIENAAEPLARMVAAYAGASFYADRGTAVTAIGRTVFNTAFVRGRRFRFEHQNTSGPYLIWSDGARTYTHWPAGARVGRPEIVDDGANIGRAIAAATGVSSGTAYTVPAMLLPVSVGHGITAHLDELSLDRVENIAGHPCARVSGSTPMKGRAVLWIDLDTYLLRRIVESRGQFEATTSYEPSLESIDVGSIEPPDVEKTPPEPRAPAPWTGIDIEIDARRIESVREGSPAARAGVQRGDEIEAVNGRRMNSFVDALKTLHYLAIGARVALTTRRSGFRLDVVFVVEPAPSPSRPAPSGPLLE